MNSLRDHKYRRKYFQSNAAHAAAGKMVAQAIAVISFIGDICCILRDIGHSMSL